MPDVSAKYGHDMETPSLRSELTFGNDAAKADRVNRTHRVVRERAKSLAERRSRVRSLWVPLSIFSVLLVGLCIAIWMLLDEYEATLAGAQVGGYQVMVPLFWSVPVSAALLAVVWFRQTRNDPARRSFE
jgi:sterol desaturase/sphingolipid hydroxylase (fatty acid hydroxylase superfamily)